MQPSVAAPGPVPATATAVAGGGSADALRAVFPLSGEVVTSARPLVRWKPSPSSRSTRVEFCRDRGCASIVTTVVTGATEARPDVPLARGCVFWRLTELQEDGTPSPAPTAAWQMWTRGGSVSQTTAWGTRPDINADGFVDVVTTRRIVFGAPGGDLSAHVQDVPASDAAAPVGDVNGDGFGDVLAFSVPDTAHPSVVQLTVLLGGPSGLGGRSVTTIFDVGLAGLHRSHPAGDVNGDGFGDFAVKVRYGTAIFLGGPDGITPGTSSAGLRFAANNALDGDVNGDGFADFVSAGIPDQDAIAIKVGFGTSSGLPPGADQQLALSADGTVAANYGVLADADGDGFTDLVIRTGRSGEHLALLSGSRSGLVPTATFDVTGLDAGLQFVASGDVRGAAQEDIIAAARDQYLVFPQGFTTPSLAVRSPTTAGNVLTVVSVGDLDGDGVEDVAWEVDGVTTVDFGPIDERGPRRRVVP